MRILFCNYEYPPLGGGGGVVNAALAQELAKRHDITVLTSRAFDLPLESIENDVRVLRVPVFFRHHHAAATFPSMLTYLLSAGWQGRRVMNARPFDLINTHFVLPTGPLGQFLSQLGRVPNVLSLHGGDLYDPSKWSSPHRHASLRYCVRRLVRRASAVTVTSNNMLANLHGFFAPELEVNVIPLGIPRPPAVTVSRPQYGFAEDDVLLVTVGRLIKRKGIDQLIDVIRQLDDSRIKLVVLGSGPLADTLRQHARQRQVESQIRFMGAVTDQAKFELLSMSNVYVSASQHEGFGLVFLEAMASGLPVISYDHGGQTDFLADGETGHLVPVNDRAAFVDRCRRLIQASDLRTTIGLENRRRAERYYIDRCARQYESLFETLLERSSQVTAANPAPSSSR